MKEKELRAHLTCNLCAKKIMHTGLPLFWTIKIDRHGIKHDAITRQSGLSMILGSAMLASIMGPDEDMTMPMIDTVNLTLCETCACERGLPIAALADCTSADSEQAHG